MTSTTATKGVTAIKNSVSELERPLPQNPDAERSVLGAILLSGTALAVAEERLLPSDFYVEPNRIIFAEMRAMRDDAIDIDTMTLTDALHKRGKLETAGGIGYINSLVDGVPRNPHLKDYCRIVKEKSDLRQLLYALDAGQKAVLEDAEEGAGVILERVAATVTELRAALATGGIFDTQDELDRSVDATFSIRDFLQDYAVNAIAGLSGHGKTWLSLNIANALLFGPGSLFELFEVPERAQKIVYLIPEVTCSAFKPRLKAAHLYDEVGKRLFIRTLSKGPALPLTDPRILREAKGADFFLDTAIRFMFAIDENSASEAAAALSNDCFVLLRAGAKSVTLLFHSPKAFLSQNYMSLEGMIRGSSEFGAVLATAWGIRQIDAAQNILHVENLKARDFEPCEPFQLVGRPHIDREGTFAMLMRPGECGSLSAYLDVKNRGGGAPLQVREAKAANKELVRQLLKADPSLSSSQLQSKFSDAGVTIDNSSIRRYRKELGRL